MVSIGVRSRYSRSLTSLSRAVQAEPDKLKKTRACADTCQLYRDGAFSLTAMLADYLERHEPPFPCVVIGTEQVAEYVNDAADEEIAAVDSDTSSKAYKDAEKTVRKDAELQVDKFHVAHLVSFQRSKWFTGVNPGLNAHVQIQMEGSRAMALVAIDEDAQFVFLFMHMGYQLMTINMLSVAFIS